MHKFLALSALDVFLLITTRSPPNSRSYEVKSEGNEPAYPHLIHPPTFVDTTFLVILITVYTFPSIYPCHYCESIYCI
jgi:hypothetical protein